MSWFREILVGMSLAAAGAQAQPAATEVRAGVWREITVSTGDGLPSAEPVPELRVAPGAATLLQLPRPIVPGDGFKVVGGEGRVEARQVSPTTIVLLTSREVGPERIPLAVATTDGRRYPFLLATRPGVVDIQVSVVFAEEGKIEQRDDAVLDAMLKGQHVFSRRYERPRAPPSWGSADTSWEEPFVESAVRIGDRYFIKIGNRSMEPWKVEQAKLEGAGGERLKVRRIHWAPQPRRVGRVGVNVSVVVVEVPEGAGADYVVKSIELVGQDARIASLEQKVSLP